MKHHTQMKIIIWNYLLIIELKIDEDIVGKNLENSENPKIIIVSGHDETIENQELFLILAFVKTFEFLRFPIFLSQVAFEI